MNNTSYLIHWLNDDSGLSDFDSIPHELSDIINDKMDNVVKEFKQNQSWYGTYPDVTLDGHVCIALNIGVGDLIDEMVTELQSNPSIVDKNLKYDKQTNLFSLNE